jgi:hypothetical protein
MIFLNRLQYKQNNKTQLIFTPLNIYPVEFVDHSTGTALKSAVGEFNRGLPCSIHDSEERSGFNRGSKNKNETRKFNPVPLFAQVNSSFDTTDFP